MTRPGIDPGAAKENRDRSRVGLVLVKATAGLLAVALVLAYLWQPPEEHGYQSAYLARANAEYVDTPVARFEYLKTGQGEPVVLVPGGGQWLFWYRVITLGREPTAPRRSRVASGR